MKSIIIIGASSGIGLGVARTYASRGIRVGVVARRRGPLDSFAAEFPGMVEVSDFDVTAPDAPDRFRELADRLPGLDTVLYAAGCGWYNPELSLDDDCRTVAVMVDGFTAMIDTAYRYFAAKGKKARIAAITSVAGVKGLGISAAYSAAKRYQWTYLQAIDQLAHKDCLPIAVTDIRPGFIHTDLLSRGPRKLPMTMPLDYAVERVVRAIDRGRRVAVVDWRWRLLTAAWTALPAAWWPKFPMPFK